MDGCPRHGTEFLKKDGVVTYCTAPTPNDEFDDICFYHLPNNRGDKRFRNIVKDESSLEKKHEIITLSSGLEVMNNAAGLEMARSWNYDVQDGTAQYALRKSKHKSLNI